MYTEWNENAVKSALAEGKKVVLFFHAGRCPSCVKVNKDLIASTLANNSVIFKVDYDTMTDLKVQYGVTSQHTFVFLDKDMNATSKKS
ncbi:thioredoxin family protein [Patescibacteria group bacterium]|nr:thioredoxin family protein [Patescibacteria group bacterium]